MKITVSQLIVKFMQRLGIRHVFGMPGAHILPVYDSLYDSPIHALLVKHEQGAAFMAGGYSRVSGEISACMTTAGPGATNLVTGIANAYADKQPILIITGETSTHIFGKGGLQESSGEGGSIDQVSLFRGITRYHKVVERTDYLGHVLNQAARILNSHASGPVLLSFPYNLQQEWVDDTLLDHISFEPPSPIQYPHLIPVTAFIERLSKAKAPVMIAGHGALYSGSGKLIAQLSQYMGIPVATSLKGKGVIDEESRLSLGSLGVTSSGYAYRYIVDHADLLIFLGAGFNERTSYLWDQALLENKILVQIDNDYAQLEKVYNADLAIHGDVKQVLDEAMQIMVAKGMERKVTPVLQTFLAESVEQAHQEFSLFQSGFELVAQFFRKLQQFAPDGSQIFDDNIIFAQNFFKVTRDIRYYPNSGISSLGHAIPAAIGARCRKESATFAILGDGGFQMCCMELMTAVNYQIPLNVIMFSNSTMGLIRKNQFQHYQQRYINCDFINPDYQQLAQSFGIHYKSIRCVADLDEIFTDCDLNHGINLIEIHIDKDTFPDYISRR